jgi:metallo-beta-lactamase family protein
MRRITIGLVSVVLFAASLLVAAEPSKLVGTSYGAAGQVAGSLHILDTGNARWMVDCGSETDSDTEHVSRESAAAKNPPAQLHDQFKAQTLPAGVEKVDAVFLTHAHADHMDRLPLLVEHGFSGPIYMTDATAVLAEIMLRAHARYDHVQPHDWTWSKERFARAQADGKSLYLHWQNCKYCKEIKPGGSERASGSLQEMIERFERETPRVKAVACNECAEMEAASVLNLAKRVKYDEPFDAGPGVRVTFLNAGHIPGSASVLFDVSLDGRQRRVLYSGDLGNSLTPVLTPPRPAPPVDAALVECTYGPIHRKATVRQQPAEFRRAVGETIAGGGVAWIPCFSLDRTQKVLYELHLAQKEQLLPERLPIYCPSPVAKEATAVYRKHRTDDWFSPAVAADAEAFFLPHDLRGTVPSSRSLPRPCVIISTSDLLGARWMQSLLADLLPEPTTGVFLVGYQSANSAGNRLLHGATTLEIDGRSVAARVTIHSFSCFSGHADAGEIDAWLANVPKTATLVLVHGDPKELHDRAEQLRSQGRERVIIAKPGEPVAF